VTSPTWACPEGITRRTVLELCAANGIPHAVRDLTTTDVYRAEEAFCTGTMGEIVGVTKVDGRPIGGGDVGALTRRLADLYRREVAATGFPIV
jgi:branched-chain amino acid aminotransferase